LGIIQIGAVKLRANAVNLLVFWELFRLVL